MLSRHSAGRMQSGTPGISTFPEWLYMFSDGTTAVAARGLLHPEPISDRQPETEQQHDARDRLDGGNDLEDMRKSFDGIGVDEVLPETQHSERIGETKADRPRIL